MASNFSALTLRFLFFFFFFFHFASLHISAAADERYVVIEDGYTVTTVIDGHKLGISPYAVMLKPGSSDLVVLDYSGSAFYTVPFPVSKETVIKRLSGTGKVGYNDGEPGSVRFNKPRSFAVDSKGNVYVADRNNNVIRKINTLGVTTTIAGRNNKTGQDDGPVQNATFSNDFELVFVVERCALLVSDHGNQLVRQIDLKAEDCRRDSGGSGHGLSAVLIWSAAVGVACIVGFVVGLVARPYIITHDGAKINSFSATWKLCPINLGKLVRILCFVIRSAVANFSLVCSLLERLFFLSLSHLSLVFSTDYLVPQTRALRKEQASLLDDNDEVRSNSSSNEMTMMSEKYANQLKDLISFDENSDLTNPTNNKTDEEGKKYRWGSEVVLSDCLGDGKVEKMIKTNLMHFAEAAEETTLVDGRSGLVKRR